MPRERFEPKKSAEYFAAYKDENEVYQTERIKFDAKKNQWLEPILTNGTRNESLPGGP